MLNITFESELQRMADALSLFEERNQKFIIMNTLNTAAFAALKQLREDTPRYIDRPRPFTVNASRVFKATIEKPVAEVDYKSGLGYNPGATPGDYLKPVVYGGERKQKRFESALSRAGILPPGHVCIPTDDVQKDQYGGVRGALYTQILSYLRANPEAQANRRREKYTKQGATKFLKQFVKGASNKAKLSSAEQRKKERGPKFVVMIKGRNNWPAPSGIYERSNTLGGKRNSSMRLIFAFVPRASYRKSFPWYEILNAASKAAFPMAFRQSVEKELMGLARRSSRRA